MNGPNKNYGKNINFMERSSGKLISSLLDEAVCFGSLKIYAQDFVKIYRRGYRDVERIMTTLRIFAINTNGKEWYKKHFDRGEKYLSKAARYLGVPTYRVVAHIVEKDIDIKALSRAIFPKDYVKAYNFFYIRRSRFEKK